MTTPAETIPVVDAVPVTATATATSTSAASASNTNISNNDDDMFHPIMSGNKSYLQQFIGVFIGRFDTFLTITIVATLPAILGYKWMMMNYFGSYYLFYYLILPFTRLFVNGSAINATAMIYLLNDNHQIPWKKAIQMSLQKQVVQRWMIQFLQTFFISHLIAPMGVFAFSSQLLLLNSYQTKSIFGAMMTSSQLIFSRPGNFFAIIGFTFILIPFLCWIQEKFLVNLIIVPLLFGGGGGSDSSEEQEPEDQENDDWVQGRQQVQEIVALPLISCLWTILYLNLCIKRKAGLKRETLAKEVGIEIPSSPPVAVARVH